MNILLIASDNNNYSGAFLSMVTLCNILSKEFKHNVSVILPEQGSGTQLLDEYHIPYEIISSYNWIISNKKISVRQRIKIEIKKVINIYSVLRLIFYMKIHKIDIVHINTSYSYVGAIGAQYMNIPYVWHIREFLEEDQNNRMWNRRYGYSLMSRADTVIAISNSIYQKYVKLLNTDRLVTIFNGIDDEIYANENHEILTEKNIRLLMVGGINKSKGQEQLVKACQLLRNKGYDEISLKIVGTGDLEYIAELHKMVLNNDLQHIIEFCGFKSNTQDYYEWADIAFVCSRMEAFGRVTVEAMMAGDLILGANTGGTRELIKDGITGLLYESENIADLTNKVIWVIENRKQAKEIAKSGQKYALTHYTARQNAKQINEIYKKIKTIQGNGIVSQN